MVTAGHKSYKNLIISQLKILVAITYTVLVTVFTFCNTTYFI